MFCEESLATARPKEINLDTYGTSYENSIGAAILRQIVTAATGGAPSPVTIQNVGSFWRDINTNRQLDVFYLINGTVCHSTGQTIVTREIGGENGAVQIAFSGVVAFDEATAVEANIIVMLTSTSATYVKVYAKPL